jgi:hypothetical protein
VGKSPLILAALAVDAAPRIGFSRLSAVERVDNLYRMGLLGNDGVDYEVVFPANDLGRSELASELGGISLIRGGNFSFAVPRMEGHTVDPDGNPVAVISRVLGEAPQGHRLMAGGFTETMALALAQIHSMPTSFFRDAGLPEYDAAANLHSRVAELDQMAATGRVPATLLGRWESAMEDVTLFRFQPTVVHGQISDQTLRLSSAKQGNRLIGITGWSGLRISDPAEDFWWLVGSTVPETHEDLIGQYQLTKQIPDDNLLNRATLYSELQQGRWLLYCLERGIEQEILSAEEGLSDLRDELEAGNLRPLGASRIQHVSAAGVRAVQETWISDPQQQLQPPGEFIRGTATELLNNYPPVEADVSNAKKSKAKAKNQESSQDFLDLEELF